MYAFSNPLETTPSKEVPISTNLKLPPFIICKFATTWVVLEFLVDMKCLQNLRQHFPVLLFVLSNILLILWQFYKMYFDQIHHSSRSSIIHPYPQKFMFFMLSPTSPICNAQILSGCMGGAALKCGTLTRVILYKTTDSPSPKQLSIAHIALARGGASCPPPPHAGILSG